MCVGLGLQMSLAALLLLASSVAALDVSIFTEDYYFVPFHTLHLTPQNTNTKEEEETSQSLNQLQRRQEKRKEKKKKKKKNFILSPSNLARCFRRRHDQEL
jgi:hypothetical protein